MMAAVLLLCSGQIGDAETVRMGYFNLPPHHYADGNPAQPRGASIVYFEAAAKHMGVEVEWVGPLPLSRLFEYLQTGRVDGTVGFPDYSGFKGILHYPKTCMFLARPVLMVERDNPLDRISTIDDIRGYRIGVNVSILNRYTPLIDEHRNLISLEALGGERWIEQNIRKLITDRIDAFYDRQSYSMLFVAEEMGLRDQVKILEVPDPPTPMCVVFSIIAPLGESLVERFNAATPLIELNYEEVIQEEFEFIRSRER